MNSPQYIASLLCKYLEGSITDAESRALKMWKAQSKVNRQFFEGLQDEQQLSQWIAEDYPDRLREIEERIFERVKQQIAIPRIVPLRRRPWLRIAIAALLIFAIGGYIFFITPGESNAPKVLHESQASNKKAPQLNRAAITLADGRTVYLDSAGNGQLAMQGDVQLVKLADGQIAYKAANSTKQEAQKYNTLTNPRGSRIIDMALADGSHIWLNSESAVTFPVAFVGTERRVEISGEAYFEVTHNTAKPFIVKINSTNGDGGEVEVLGTHFNINAYNDEPGTKTTLLEGSVKVKKQNAIQLLAPGQQARMTAGGISLIRGVNLASVMAWKDGFFEFDNTDIRTLMHQVARWYDVDLRFEGPVSKEGITGRISKQVQLSSLLEALKLNDIHVQTNGKTITILP
ncbi:MAG: FecR domain-containing protein [Niabella sp.]|nr:FecR domain-containing protein [Niabella sp.]